MGHRRHGREQGWPLRLGYPGLGYGSGDLYGKVGGREEREGARLTRIRLTSVDEPDQKVLEMFIG